MKNDKYIPFERNKYYYGKLLTSKDFEQEQTYINDKRRFINKAVTGVGITKGLNVYMADNTSLIVESGAAIDGYGREIVVAQPIIKKISTIDGYENIEDETAFLCIDYDEGPIDVVYSVAAENQGEYNRIKEGYKLSFVKRENIVISDGINKVFLSNQILYDDKDICVSMTIPKFVLNDKKLVVKLSIFNKRVIQSNKVSLDMVLKTPNFKFDADKPELRISFDNFTLPATGVYEQNFELINLGQFYSITTFLVESFEINYGWKTKRKATNDNVSFEISASKDNLLKTIQDKYFDISLDDYIKKTTDNTICLAKINLLKSQTASIIDSIEKVPFGQYIPSAEVLYIKESLNKYFPSNNSISASQTVSNEKQNIIDSFSDSFNIYSHFASGSVEIPVKLSSNLKKPIFSDEIVHGLGRGNVYVSVAVEYIVTSEGTDNISSEMIIGDTDIFKDTLKNTNTPIVTSAVKVKCDRGTFVVGLRFAEQTQLISVMVKWFAYKLPQADKKFIETKNGVYMLLNPDTIVLSPLEGVCFSPVFINTQSTACTFSVVESDGGVIDDNGYYIAPNKEGVFEVVAQSVSDKSQKAYAFVMVTKKKTTAPEKEIKE